MSNYDVANALVAPVMQQESGGDPNAQSSAGAGGLMQIMPATARDPGFGITPLQGWDNVNPATASREEQIRFGRDYLAAMNKRYGGDVDKTLAAYNAGPGAVDKAGGVPNYKETQNYVSKIEGNAGIQMADNSGSDWQSRAQPVMSDAGSAVQIPAQDPTSIAIPDKPVTDGSDWQSRATPVDAPVMNKPIQVGNDMGRGSAVVMGFNSAVPFGQRASAGIGATIAYPYEKIADAVHGRDNNLSFSDYYKNARENQQATEQEHPGAELAGTGLGIVATLPMASAKVLGGGAAATTGIRGAANAVPEALTSVGNYVRGSQVAADAGTLAKTANLAGKAVRSASVAAPTSALYSYGASNHDLDSQGAVGDAVSGAKVGAVTGAALPVAGALLSGAKNAVLPNIGQDIKDLADKAVNKFGIKLSVDQIAPSGVRNTVQKVSQALPGSGVQGFQDAQHAQWNKALAGTLGQDADNLGPAVIKDFLTQSNKDFTQPLDGKTINFTQGDINDIADIAAGAKKQVSTGLSDVVQNNVDDVLDNLSKFKVGEQRSVPGEKLASLRSELVQSLPTMEGGAKQQVAKIVDKIDDVIDRHLTPEESQTLTTARQQWKNYKTIDPLLQKSTDGTVNPTQLLQKVASNKFIPASRIETGDNDLVDLARIGKQFLGRKGGSDTFEKGATLGLGASVAALPFAPGAAVPALLTQGATMGANRLFQKGINQSPKVIKAIINKGASNGSSSAVPIGDMLTSQLTQRTPNNRLVVTIHPPKTGPNAQAWRDALKDDNN